MGTTTLDRVAEDMRARAARLRAEVAERERVFRAETQRVREELTRLEGALRAMEGDAEVPGRSGEHPLVPRAPRGRNEARILGVMGERSGVSAAGVALARDRFAHGGLDAGQAGVRG